MFRSLRALFWIAFRTELFNLPQIISQSVFFVLILSVFNFLWREAAKSGLPLPASASQMVWYLAVTEVIALSVTAIHREIETDLHKGRIAAALLRPVHYLKVICWQAAGTIIARILVFGVVGVLTAVALTGEWPAHRDIALASLALTPIACAVLIIFIVSVGLSAVWLRECSPVYWVFQKCLFVFGGLMLPISMYPDWFRSIAAVLPFQPILCGVAQGLLGATSYDLLRNLGLLALWFLVGLSLAAYLHAQYVRKVLRGEL